MKRVFWSAPALALLAAVGKQFLPAAAAQTAPARPSVVAFGPGRPLPATEFFRAEKIAPNIVRITGIAGEQMYLVEGRTQALLLDTGTGVGNLSAYVQQLTSQPLSVVLTHGHVDHAFGAARFATVYMNHADDSIYTAHSSLSLRKDFLRVSTPKAASIKDTDFTPPTSPARFQALPDGQVFDLGGTTAVVYHFAGHTPGQVAVLLREPRLLLTGDGANQFTFLFSNPRLGVRGYETLLEHLMSETAGRYDKILVSHGPGEAPVSLLPNLVSVCEAIKAGRSDEAPFDFMGTPLLLAKKLGDKTMMRADGVPGNLVYARSQAAH